MSSNNNNRKFSPRLSPRLLTRRLSLKAPSLKALTLKTLTPKAPSLKALSPKALTPKALTPRRLIGAVKRKMSNPQKTVKFDLDNLPPPPPLKQPRLLLKNQTSPSSSSPSSPSSSFLSTTAVFGTHGTRGQFSPRPTNKGTRRKTNYHFPRCCPVNEDKLLPRVKFGPVLLDI